MQPLLRVLPIGALFLWTAQASAQACSEDAQARADSSFSAGVEAFDAQRFEEARTLFEAAYEACSTIPAVLNRLGLVHAELGDSAEASRFLSQYLASAGRTLDRRARSNLERLIAQHSERVGTVVFDVPSDLPAVVYVDGRMRIRLPASEPLRVAAGEREVRVEAPLRSSHVERIVIAPGTETRISAALPIAPVARGTLRIVSPLRRAEVRVDGELVGETPLSRPIPVELGTHVVSARRAGYEPDQREVEVANEDETTVELRPRIWEQSDPASWGRLEIVVPRGRGDVRVDGSVVSTVDLIDLPEGEHEVTVAFDGREPYAGQIVVRRGETATIEPELRWTNSVQAERSQRFGKRRFWGFVGAGAGVAVAVGGAAYLAWGESRVSSDELRAYNNCRGLVDTYVRAGYSPSAVESMTSPDCYAAEASAAPDASAFFHGTPSGFDVTARGAALVEATEQRGTARVVGGILIGVGAAGAIAGLVVALTAPSEDSSVSGNETPRDAVEVEVSFSPTSISLSGSF